ncbi:MAG TPA: V-type ATPase 116kDa subunit family protein [Bacilli bacterium]|nr:V-type ATPase 116kDa subunit family protein [Bacilli bacterium]
MISKLKLVNLTTTEEHLDEVLGNFVTFDGFHAVDPNKIVSSVHGAKLYESDNPCEPLIAELHEIEKLIDYKFPKKKIACAPCKIEEIGQLVESTHQGFTDKYAEIKKSEEQIKTYQEALFQVRNIISMKTPFEDLFKLRFLLLRFGKLPRDTADRLRFYDQKPFIFLPFAERDGVVWCLYMTTEQYKTEIDNIFTSMFFERIHIPDFVQGTPEVAIANLDDEIGRLERNIRLLKKDIFHGVEEAKEKVDQVYGQLLYLSDIHRARNHMVCLGERLTLTGFIEQKQVKNFQKLFAEMPSVEIQIEDAEADKRFQPPTKLRNNWFTRPFQFFVDMYGTPSYHDVDPTLMVAITYSLLFGIMFGDLGQGLLLCLIGIIMSRVSKNRLGPILTRIGISSALFGVVYGETFGNSTFLEPFYTWLSGLVKLNLHPIHPMDNTMTMNLLLATVGIGSIIILSTIAINLIAKFKARKFADALFSSNGLSGLILYGFVLSGIVMQMFFNIPGVFNVYTIIFLIVLPVILIFLKEPIDRKMHHQKMFPDGVGGFLIEGFFELFEVILSYVTNTLSFLRVGGFVLSHAGMMLVVATLMQMTSGTGSIVVMILGNLFVMGLEGLIVGIQVLRLEFYEMFSRYFEGDGIIFDPLI